MRQNPDCIRDLLLFVEAQPFGSEIVIRETLPPELSKYSFDEIKYHAGMCNQSGYLNGYSVNILDDITIDSLSESGNRFLDTIRPDTVWEKTKSTASKVGSFSLDFFAKVAASVTAELIKRQIN